MCDLQMRPQPNSRDKNLSYCLSFKDPGCKSNITRDTIWVVVLVPVQARALVSMQVNNLCGEFVTHRRSSDEDLAFVFLRKLDSNAVIFCFLRPQLLIGQ